MSEKENALTLKDVNEIIDRQAFYVLEGDLKDYIVFDYDYLGIKKGTAYAVNKPEPIEFTIPDSEFVSGGHFYNAIHRWRKLSDT